MPRISVRVAQKIIEADSVVRYVLVSASGHALPSFAPGAHIDVEVTDRLIRQYSLCNTDGSDSDNYHIAVLKDKSSRGGSELLHTLKAGQRIKVSPPRNSFPLGNHRKTVLLAGGIGITPLIPMAHELARAGKEFELHYSSRSKESAAFYVDLLEWKFAGSVRFYFSDGQDHERVDFRAVLSSQCEGAHFYACGPITYIRAFIEAAEDLRVPKDRIHTESFQPVQDSTRNATFQIQIASSGDIFDVPGDKSISDVLQENSIDVATSCEQGICGACLMPVRSGEIDHRDSYLTDAERDRNDQMTICCSRGEGILVLDC
ncbi:PDR/VanB family oxidoreductase [Pseudomonas sp. PS1]|uniref:PDR/VanB family oxidoreductase n=1 Tax=Stutzerimonas marianensis TaxID=2929513 RepID=A0A9X1W4K0_9GAMM|nr:PDR/VanB family oxidoreductase [Pseudomonas marianensis]MCJ0973217.1 PDR/VanB family oxidoreductase [Pseudomonas marianensis]